MSTNPFRHSSSQSLQAVQDRDQNVNEAVSDNAEIQDGHGLSLDTHLDRSRHVSFASPPVNSTIPASSYPSSPESAKSPPLALPEYYRTALLSDAFTGLGDQIREDPAMTEAFQNTQRNMAIGRTQKSNMEDAVQTTLGRFAAPTGTPHQTKEHIRQSMDVDAFARMLLTGDRGLESVQVNSPSTDTTPLSTTESSPPVDGKPRVPPPRPAPRRNKSIHHHHNNNNNKAAEDIADHIDTDTIQMFQQPVRHSSYEPEAQVTKSMLPPPPPMRRQASTSNRSSSIESSTRPEEMDPSATNATSGSPTAPALTNRHPTDERPPPPPSRNSSHSLKRQSLGAANPPPLPPPRRGRVSSRSSVDSFRPTLSSITGAGESEEAQDLPTSTIVPSAQDILAELAILKRDVDAARRSA